MRTSNQDAVLNVCTEALVKASGARLGIVVSEHQNWHVLRSATKPEVSTCQLWRSQTI